MTWGAAPEEWARYSLDLGWTADLLPIVCNPNARISPRSSLKKLGKTPSVYNRDGLVAGIKDWTRVVARPADVASWSKESDYGICLQTRRIRAFDIDIDDAEGAAEVLEIIERELGGSTAIRRRADSARILVLVELPGEHVKRTAKREGGIVEFLGDGQQCVIAGTHERGSRYELSGVVRACSLEQLDAIFERLGASPVQRNHQRNPRSQADHQILAPPYDPVWDWLLGRGWVVGDREDGGLLIACPWREDHSGDSGPTECAYWPPGTGGFAQGHFHCLHAHCAERTDADFLDAIGFAASIAQDFPDAYSDAAPARSIAPAGAAVAPLSADSAVPLAWRSPVPGQGLRRGKKGFLATLQNIARALDTAGWERAIGHDTFRQALCTCSWGELLIGDEQWRPLEQHELIRLRRLLGELGFEPIGRELMRDAVELVARSRSFDSAQVWLERQQWDGVARIDRFFVEYAGCGDSAYSRAVGAYLWTALAGRVIAPGVQADMVPVLITPEQGRGKTRGIEALVPDPDFYCTVDLSRRDEELARRMRGRMVYEIGELRGLHSKDLESINLFITERNDLWVPKYNEFAVITPRRGIFVASTNSTQFLDSLDGARRWLPLQIERIDPERVAAVRSQLWAEGASRFREGGVAWRDAERLAQVEHGQWRMIDLWEPEIVRWIEERSDASPFTTHMVAQGIGLDVRKIGRAEEMRMSRVLKSLGYESSRRRAPGDRLRFWEKS